MRSDGALEYWGDGVIESNGEGGMTVYLGRFGVNWCGVGVVEDHSSFLLFQLRELC